MARPPDAELVSRVIFVDGEPFLITRRDRRAFMARRLLGRERAVALRLLTEAHEEAFARLGPR